jgi:DNA-binding response OmpR family regulator
MTKPCVPEELLARVKAQLRRNSNSTDNSEILRYENIVFDTENHIVKVGAKVVQFTKKEIQLIHFFLTHTGRLIPKNKIIYSVWNSSDFSSVSDNTINVTISKIRKKL